MAIVKFSGLVLSICKYALSKCYCPTESLFEVPTPARGHSLPDTLFKCYQISPNILIRPLNLSSAQFS